MARRRKPRVHRVVPNALGGHIKWSVLWVVPTDGGYRIIQHECGNDLGEAVRLYSKVVAAGKRFPTLRSDNVGFPPPEQLRPYTARVRNKLWVKGKRQKGVYKYKFVDRVPMAKRNRVGVWWCPYCRELRRFQQLGAFMIEGVPVPDKDGHYCPICGVSHRDWHVRKWNPVAYRLFVNQTS